MGKSISDDQLVECFDLVFESTHSPGFKKAEMMDLLFADGYWFLEKPKEDWKKNLTKYLIKIDFDLSTTNLDRY